MKRRRCIACGQFAGKNHECVKDIETELQADEPLGVLYKIPDTAISVSPARRKDILHSLANLELSDFLLNHQSTIPNDCFISSLRPANVTPILVTVIAFLLLWLLLSV